ncbi:hypothetical protein VN97_g5778 [Penicillium thymicola]|uniref:Uncharacterized protein n=1 Tax=Penicillium thymicola TaxID=293382 RepID=A0AAI9TI48_PENTH|nr:hypothetical protein VN97_g5778 [Penicillium thymicola]
MIVHSPQFTSRSESRVYRVRTLKALVQNRPRFTCQSQSIEYFSVLPRIKQIEETTGVRADGSIVFA